MQTPFDQRNNNFDMIRTCLAVLVIFSHSYPLGTGTEVREPLVLLTHGQVTFGHMAVDLFFVISGFLITSSYERSKTSWSYLAKRIRRIYPGFIVAALWCGLLVVPLGGGRLYASSITSRPFDFLIQTIQLRELRSIGAFPHNPMPAVLNGSLWSIPYEFWCYIGLALLGATGLLRSNRFMMMLFAASIAISIAFGVYQWTPGGKLLGQIFGYPPFWARLLPMYLAGVVFYRFRSHLSLRRRWILLAIVGMVAAALLPQGWSLMFPVVGAYLVLVFAFHPSIRLHDWNRFGDFSYGTYLYAFPVQQLLMHWIGHPISPWKLFSLAAPATIGCAALSWHLVEKRFLRSGQGMNSFSVTCSAPAQNG